MGLAIPILAIIGFCLSAHALWINHQFRRRMRYTPWCDFSENVSCSRAFTSKQSRILGIHNAWFGLVAYPVTAWLALTDHALALVYAGTILALAALYLAYLAFVRMRNYCIVCSVIYVINVAIFLLAITGY